MRTILAVLVALSATDALADAPRCRSVRMADTGWADVSFTNGTAEMLLDALGYDAKQTLVSLNLAFLSLENDELDVFQGNWLPIQDKPFRRFFDEGSVEVLSTNLSGAKFTLAVPKYVSEAGVKDFSDLAAHADRFDRKIYGIEPGSGQVLLDMIAADRFGLAGWKLVESSENAMLAQVRKAVLKKRWIVFLGWEPHPMNVDYQITYLSGGDREFGPNYGGAVVRTIARRGFATECPNVAKVFANLVYDLDYENHGMRLIVTEGLGSITAARMMLRRNPQKLEAWLRGVTTFDGKPALPRVKAELDL